MRHCILDKMRVFQTTSTCKYCGSQRCDKTPYMMEHCEKFGFFLNQEVDPDNRVEDRESQYDRFDRLPLS